MGSFKQKYKRDQVLLNSPFQIKIFLILHMQIKSKRRYICSEIKLTFWNTQNKQS